MPNNKEYRSLLNNLKAADKNSHKLANDLLDKLAEEKYKEDHPEGGSLDPAAFTLEGDTEAEKNMKKNFLRDVLDQFDVYP